MGPYLLPCNTTQYREPPSKGCAFPHLSPGDPSALQHRPSSPARKETETRGLVQDCPALHCIIGHAAEQKHCFLSVLFWDQRGQACPLRSSTSTCQDPSSSAPWQHDLSTTHVITEFAANFPGFSTTWIYIYREQGNGHGVEGSNGIQLCWWRRSQAQQLPEQALSERAGHGPIPGWLWSEQGSALAAGLCSSKSQHVCPKREHLPGAECNQVQPQREWVCELATAPANTREQVNQQTGLL